MEEYTIIIFRTIFLYGLISVIYRLMGKREIGELSVLDVVVSIMLAELAVTALEQTESSLFKNVLPMLILLLLQVTFAYISLKSKKFRDVVDGKPTIIINNGKIDEYAMKKQNYNFDDLLLQLRDKDIALISDVELAVLESSGHLSVFTKKAAKNGVTWPLILDGVIQYEHLENINKTDEWLLKELGERGYHSIDEISFCSFENGRFYIDIKNEIEK
ncbi:DUF421 domain-containing protein [Cytobacillus gottheilii]|uniref:DUF421 domain-containing protein n=1 Tax=Cytobacillus gottheilii TaxID=859144 RepID=A0ABX8F928_9BACI|nr:DUF421 domain-containing protein [Cytobacillus gottheilii]QVY60504.1 DUF421 domain-containing protein [Cytobacillus gottheilii]